jgi:polyphosphate kinase
MFDEALLKQLTEIDANGNINLHYHGDGLKKDPRHVHVLEKDAVSHVRKPRIHQSVFDLMRHDKVFLADAFHSFSAVQKILYSPRGIGGFEEKNVAVE